MTDCYRWKFAPPPYFHLLPVSQCPSSSLRATHPLSPSPLFKKNVQLFLSIRKKNVGDKHFPLYDCINCLSDCHRRKSDNPLPTPYSTPQSRQPHRLPSPLLSPSPWRGVGSGPSATQGAPCQSKAATA